MTIQNVDLSLSQFPFDALVQRPGLRLVGNNGADGLRENEDLADIRALPCAELVSAIAEKTPITLSALTDLFKNLRRGERIEFVHRISRSDASKGAGSRSYWLAVKVAGLPGQEASLKNKVLEALLTAFPGFHLGASAEAPDCLEKGPLPHVLQLALSGLVVAARPTVARFEDQTVRSSPVLGRLSSDAVDRERQIWPFPGNLANWALTAPLSEPLDLPDTVEISVRMHAFSISEDECESLHKTLFRVLSGNLAIFHPESPVASYSASTDLQEPVADLIRHWLRHPSGGYAVDCVIRSSASIGEVAQRRIAADMFGKRPFEVVRSFDLSAPQSLAQPTFAWANTPDQGIPAIMPGQVQLPTLGIPRHYPEPLMAPPQVGTVLGTTVCGNRSSAVSLPSECRSRHVTLLGATGSGKSSLLKQMIAADIADPQRNCGVGLIDPHGDLVDGILAMIPPERADDVVLVDVGDMTSTACLNPLEGMRDDPILAQYVVGEIISLIDMLFETKDSSGPQKRNCLRNLLLLAASTPGRHGTLMDVLRILEDSDYCDYLLSKCKNRNVVDFWGKFRLTRSSDNGFGEWLPYLMAPIAPFTTSPIMKRLLSRPDSTIDLAQAMRDKKIVLFNLNKSVLQDTEAQVLGSLILMKFFSAALARARLPADQRPPFHLYVDEFQSFATDSVPRMFAEARKFGLCLTTANQSLGQLQNRWGRSNIAESILANTATKFLFRLGPADMDTLQAFYKPQFGEETMANLPDFHAVACMADNNRPLPPFVFRATLATPIRHDHVPAETLRELSRQRYSVPTDQANKELIELFDLSAESLAVRAPEPPPMSLPYRPGPAMRAASVSSAQMGE